METRAYGVRNTLLIEEKAAAGAPPGFDRGRYQVLKELGHGGMGIVYGCLDRQLSRQVAVKALSAELRREPQLVECFLKEAQALAALDHPNLVKIYDARKDLVADEQVPYLVMEYVEGRTLERLIYTQGEPLVATLESTLLLFLQVAEALSYCHRRGIIHRDIKPANMLVQRDGQVKLIDFGLARSMDLLLQRSTQVRGTPAYMAPEQVTAGTLGPATDLYAFGISLFEALCRRMPFAGGELAYHQVHSEPPPPSTFVPDLPPQVERLVLRCLAKDPGKRPASAEEVAVELRQLLGTLGCRAAQPPRRRNRLLAGAVLLALGTAAAVLVLGRGQKPHPRTEVRRPPEAVPPAPAAAAPAALPRPGPAPAPQPVPARPLHSRRSRKTPGPAPPSPVVPVAEERVRAAPAAEGRVPEPAPPVPAKPEPKPEKIAEKPAPAPVKAVVKAPAPPPRPASPPKAPEVLSF